MTPKQQTVSPPVPLIPCPKRSGSVRLPNGTSTDPTLILVQLGGLETRKGVQAQVPGAAVVRSGAAGPDGLAVHR